MAGMIGNMTGSVESRDEIPLRHCDRGALCFTNRMKNLTAIQHPIHNDENQERRENQNNCHNLLSFLTLYRARQGPNRCIFRLFICCDLRQIQTGANHRIEVLMIITTVQRWQSPQTLLNQYIREALRISTGMLQITALLIFQPSAGAAVVAAGALPQSRDGSWDS
jgi:hypothetical protein